MTAAELRRTAWVLNNIFGKDKLEAMGCFVSIAAENGHMLTFSAENRGIPVATRMSAALRAYYTLKKLVIPLQGEPGSDTMTEVTEGYVRCTMDQLWKLLPVEEQDWMKKWHVRSDARGTKEGS